jgi:SAM-dependent methyltransferase
MGHPGQGNRLESRRGGRNEGLFWHGSMVAAARLRSVTDPHRTPTDRPASPAEAGDVRAMHRANRAAWDQAAERYEGWYDEAVDLIRSGGSNLFPVEHDLIGDLHGSCHRAIHLQCAAGRDTLSLWNLGAAEVIGVDISPRMLALAARLAKATGAPARWIEADVLDTPNDLDGTADLVYTGRGAIIWLQDLAAWATVLRRLLSPTGRLVIFDGHPAEWLFDADATGRLIATDYDYFGGVEASKGWAPEFIDHLSVPEGDQSWKFARAWTLGEIVTALLRAGLRLERLVEYPVDWWAGHRDLRPEDRGRIPLSFGIVARRG